MVPQVVVRDAATGRELAAWALGDGDEPDLTTVEALALLRLAGSRLGWSIGIRHPCPELRGLLDLAGLADVLGED